MPVFPDDTRVERDGRPACSRRTVTFDRDALPCERLQIG